MPRLQLVPFTIVVLASAGLAAGQTTVNTTYVDFFNSLAVCAPFNVLVTESTDARFSISVSADAATSSALRIVLSGSSGGVGLGIQSIGDFTSSNPVKITLSLPPGVFKYSELDYSNSDLVFNNTFNVTKGEIANNGDGSLIIARGMNGDLNKVSIVG